MSDTVKLIIEIPKETYKGIMLGKWDGNGLAFYVKTGTPLDDVKAKVKKKYRKVAFMIINEYGSGYNYAVDEMLEILDNIGKESEE